MPRSKRNLSGSGVPVGGRFGPVAHAPRRRAQRQHEAHELPGRPAMFEPRESCDHRRVRQPSILCLYPFLAAALCGAKPRSARASDVSAYVSRMSPFCAGSRRTSSGLARDPADDLDHVVHRHARSAADVVGAPGHARVAGGDRRGHRIVDESEIPGLLAVAVQRDRLASAAPI